MRTAIARSFLVAACISSLIYAILTITHWVAPQLFRTSFDLWIWVLLFAVAFVPRLVTILVQRVLAASRRRKT